MYFYSFWFPSLKSCPCIKCICKSQFFVLFIRNIKICCFFSTMPVLQRAEWGGGCGRGGGGEWEGGRRRVPQSLHRQEGGEQPNGTGGLSSWISRYVLFFLIMFDSKCAYAMPKSESDDSLQENMLFGEPNLCGDSFVFNLASTILIRRVNQLISTYKRGSVKWFIVQDGTGQYSVYLFVYEYLHIRLT